MLASAPAIAQPVSVSTVTGGILARACANSHDTIADFCTGYILGAADQLQVTKRICRPPSDAGTFQTVEIVRKFIRENPKEWSKHGMSLVEEPLVQAFPCQESQ
jgi:hypothetical protein